MNSRMFFAAVAVLSVIVLAALSAALPSALLPGNTAYAQTNSAPQFPSSETGTRTVDENTPWYQNIGDPVVATDPDDDKLTYSLENARTSPFTIDRFTGQLQTGAPLDYETQATYTAKVIAADRLEPDDPSRATDTITVTIDVNNVDEPGKVSLTWTRLQVGAEVEASLTDPDGNVSGVTWHWEKPSDRSSWTAISTATQATYTPVEGDVNRYLRAVASYTDPLGAEKTAWSAAAFVKPVPDPNQTPDFRVNTGGGYDCRQGETADVCLYIKRHAPPGSEIHYPGYVYITDHDQVRYSIGGADAVKFRIGPLSGDLYTMDAHAYDNPGTDGKFEITITATDPSGRSDSIDVALRPSGSAGSPTVRGPEEIRYPENGTWPLATYSATASNPDRDIHGWIISVEPGGGGGDFFDIDDDGVLTFTQPPDYEDPADENGDNTYSFTIVAYDTNPPSGRRPGRTSFSVRVTVADVNEPPEFSVETASRTIAENTTTGADIGAPVTATDPDTGDTLTYTLEGADLDSFDIDSASGQIQTKSGVTYDHEIKSSYSVTVKADDNNGGTATIDVTITVADVDEPPEFDSATATREVPENTEAGENIGAPVTAADPDTGDTPAYTLDGTDATFFDIDASTGQLQTKAALDYETKSGYTVTVTASDGTLTATVDVTVTVTNIDEAGTVALSTNQPSARAEITAALTDPDEGVTGDVWQWERSSDGNTDWADIGTSSPSYTPVDGDVGYHLRATASYTDGHGPGKTARAASTQAVQAGANRPPEFDSATATREVPENTEAGENIGAPVTAADPDTGDTPAYTLGGTDATFFDIDASTGQLQTQAALDYETKSGYTVTVTASDGALTATVDVTVTVTNVDEAGTVILSTNQPPARAEITAALTDPDEGVTGAVWQWERSSDGNTDWADIGTSSPSYTPVDGDVGYHLRARASYTDGHGPGKTAQAASTQAVQAGANRPPEFDSATATREVPENTEAGENIGAPVTAADPDTGDTPAYTLEGADADSFGIDSASGQIQTKSGVTYDHEVKSSYSVTVKADDNNGGTATIDVTITVADVNEPPEFSVETASRTIAENTTTGVAIGAPVTAADPDTGDTPAYTLEGADLDSFDIDSASGQIQTKSGVTYDHEVKSSYSVTVKADDNNGGTATIDVTITVADVNEPPEFSVETASRTIAENTTTGADIGAPVTAADPDTGDTLTYTLEGADLDSFDIDSASGQIQTKSGVTYDHEIKSSYSVTVKADDNNGGTATIDVTITVADVDEPPEFDSATATREVPENTEAGENIGAPVTAADPDTGDTPAYTLGGTDATFFDIDASTGQLQTKAALDYETKSGYTVTVTASDGTLTATVDVTVTITNIDEAGTVALSTNQPSARAEITAALTDPDEGVTGDVWQWERSSDGNTDWADIGTSSPSYTPVDGDVGYHLRATASYTDGHGPGKTAQAASTQAVQAGANRPPEFDSATATREVPENTEAGENIGAPVTAADPDTGDTPAYTLGGTDATFFDIDASTGQLQTKAALDYETKSGYTVTVTASDGTLTATVDVTVTVTNIDEAGTVALSTNQPPARAEITAALTDPDEGVTGAVWQWERSSDGNTDWADIGTSSPSYTPVDGDVGYHLRARASYTDGHGPGKTAQAASTQAVQAGANRPPEFDSATATREVPENTEAGENIGAPVTAADPDTGDTPAYTLEGADLDSFDIDSASGQIQTKSGVTYDYETKSSYSVTVKADDNNGGTATIDVTITVADVDEPPEFDSATATREVPENTEAGGNIGVPVTAADPDTGDTLTYTLEGADADSFGIDSASGQIQTKSGVTYDHEVKSSYSVTVKADDNNGGTATIDVTITVADVNEPPEFSVETASRTIAENTTTGVAIGAPVTATDPDTGDTLTYTLEGADLDSFDIDSASGQIQTKSGVTYDHEVKSSYSVTVKADDNNGGTATIDVTITVADVNEPPEFSVETASRTIAENTTTGVAIGAPVTATDPDTGDTPAYTLEGADLDSFDIDSASGQIQTKSGVTYDHEVKSSYSVTVKADDNNGGTATIDVTITVADVNEPPEFDSATATREVPENTEAGENIGAPVTATDPDTGDTPAYTLGGTDATFFDIDTLTGQLQTQAALDYETKSGYTVTVTASDGTLTATVDVTVTVTNVDEAGTVTLSTNQPPARAEITAALTDPDEGVTGAVWQWERSSDGNTDWADIGTSSPSYTPVDGDVGYHLRATASYTDGHGPGKTAQAASTQAVQAGANRPPEFDSATATREVPENTEAGENIGSPITANDPDNDTLTYTLGGADASSFDIGRSTGQITVGAGTALDYAAGASYTVSVTAADPSGSSAAIGVTIAVFDEDLGELGSRYDTDNDRVIGRDEAISAIIDYFADLITRDEVVGVIILYFAS